MFERFYEGSYRRYLLLSAVVGLIFLFLVFVSPGVKLGIELRGGTLISIQSPQPIAHEELERVLREKFQLSDLSITSTSSPLGSGTTIQYAFDERLSRAEKAFVSAKNLSHDPSAARAALLESREAYAPLLGETAPAPLPDDGNEALALVSDELALAKEHTNVEIQSIVTQSFQLGSDAAFQTREVSPVLGAAFVETSITVALVAIVAIVLVVFVFFREFIPSIAVIEAGLFDMLAALAGMAVFNIPLSLNTIPALLMLVGYSIDTDILLTTRVLKRNDFTPAIRAGESMLTGITMTLATIVAVSIMLVFSYLQSITVIFEIAAVLLFGMIGDLVATWCTNAPILLWYVESKNSKLSSSASAPPVAPLPPVKKTKKRAR